MSINFVSGLIHNKLKYNLYFGKKKKKKIALNTKGVKELDTVLSLHITQGLLRGESDLIFC